MKKAIFAIGILSVLLFTSVVIAAPTEAKPEGMFLPTVGAIKVETFLDKPTGEVAPLSCTVTCEGGVHAPGTDLIVVIIPQGQKTQTVTVTFTPTGVPAFIHGLQPKTETYEVGPGLFGALIENDYKYHQVHWWA